MIFMIFHIRGWLIFVLLFLNERRATIQMYPYQNFKCVLPTRNVTEKAYMCKYRLLHLKEAEISLFQ